MNGRNISKLIHQWLKGNLVTKEELENMTAVELIEKLREDKY